MTEPESQQTRSRPRRTFYSLLGVPSRLPPHPSTSPTSPNADTADPSNSPISAADSHAGLTRPGHAPAPPTMYPPKFDRAHKFVTSPLFRNPFVFGGLRILTGLYILVTQIVFLAEGDGGRFFSYFTNLSYTGLCAYFLASGVQTLLYARRWKTNGAGAGYALQETWPRPLQALHVVLHGTVVTFPFIVTAVFWSLLSSPEVFETTRRAWTTCSVHILNAVLAACELVFTNSPPVPWLVLPFTVLLLAGYVGVAYVTWADQGFYTYSFLDPSTSGSLLAAYLIGIAAAQCILFAIVHYIAVLREILSRRYNRVIVLADEEEEEGYGRWSWVHQSGGGGAKSNSKKGSESRGAKSKEREDGDDDDGWENISKPEEEDGDKTRSRKNS